MDELTVLGVAAVVLLIAISAFFSSSELAIFSLDRHWIATLEDRSDASAGALVALRDDPHRLLVTVLVGNNVANIAAASVTTALLVRQYDAGVAVAGATVVTSVFVLVLGEIAPKSYAISHAESWSLRVSRPLRSAQLLMRPVVAVFEAMTDAVNRVTGGRSDFETYLTRDEVTKVIEAGEREGVIDPDEGVMLRGVFDLSDLTVAEVMVPKPVMVGVDHDASPDDVLDTCVEHRVSSVPVYGTSTDEVTGLVHVRDAIWADRTGAKLSEVTTTPLFVPESKPLDELLDEFLAARSQVAIVIDEFGTVEGLVTLEDVLEEIIGEVVTDGELEFLRPLDDGSAIALGRTPVAVVNEALGTTFPTGANYATLAGFMHAQAGRLLSDGDAVEFDGLRLTVERTHGHRIRRVRIDGIDTISGENSERFQEDDT